MGSEKLVGICRSGATGEVRASRTGNYRTSGASNPLDGGRERDWWGEADAEALRRESSSCWLGRTAVVAEDAGGWTG